MPSTNTDRIGGLSTSVAIKAPCLYTTTGNITLSGLSVQGNGEWVSELTAGDRVFVRSQTSGVDNGIWEAGTGTWQRAKDFDGARDVVQGTLVSVYRAGADFSIYKLDTANPIVIGTTSLSFSAASDFALAGNLANQTNTALGAALVGYRGRTVHDKLDDIANVMDYGAVGDGVTDDSAACQAAHDASGYVFYPNGEYLFSLSVTVNANNRIIGESIDGVQISTDDDHFAFVVSVPRGTTEFECPEVAFVTINAKNALAFNYSPGDDYFNGTPARSYWVHDVNLVGTYDSSADANAGTQTLYTRADLEALGVGLNSVMCYGAKRERVNIRGFGIGLAVVGDTVSRTEGGRIHDCARLIHDERIAWYNSSFGMGAENDYQGVDLLDGRRHGSVWFEESYGCKFTGNYLESLDRGGAISASCMLYQNSTAHVAIEKNHLNAFLSYDNSQPFYVFRSSRAARSDTGNNITRDNYLTPFTQVDQTTVDIEAGLNYSSPGCLYYLNNARWPKVFQPNAITAARENNVFDYQNFGATTLGGTLALDETPWVSNSQDGWHLDPVASELVFWLDVINPSQALSFVLSFDVDDNSATSGSNGRMFVNVKDSDDTTTLFNDFAFTGVTAPTRRTIVVTSAVRESVKRLRVSLNTPNFCKFYRLTATPHVATPQSELTIASGAITVYSGYHNVDTEANAASDDLDTINGGADGMRLVLQANNAARTVVCKDGTGNLKLAGDFSLDNTEDTIDLIFNAVLNAWCEIGRSDNGA